MDSTQKRRDSPRNAENKEAALKEFLQKGTERAKKVEGVRDAMKEKAETGVLHKATEEIEVRS